jgi:DNA-binding NtrC family response regulator
MSHVLIVDDDTNSREALAALATQGGFTTAIAGSVAEARAQLARQRPDVVLMDVRLPDGGGIDLLEDLEGRLSIETILITRELKKHIHRVFIKADDSPATSNGPAITVQVGTPLSVAARELILSTLAHCGGERKRTAEMLGICTKTLYNRLREYGVRAEAG